MVWAVEELNLPLAEIQQIEQNLPNFVALPESAWSVYKTEDHLQKPLSSKWLRIDLCNVSDHRLFRLLEFEHTLNAPEHLFIALKQHKKIKILPVDEVQAVLPSSIFIAFQMQPKSQIYVF